MAIFSSPKLQFGWACEAGNNSRPLNLHKHPSSFIYTGSDANLLIHVIDGKSEGIQTFSKWKFFNSNRGLDRILYSDVCLPGGNLIQANLSYVEF